MDDQYLIEQIDRIADEVETRFDVEDEAQRLGLSEQEVIDRVCNELKARYRCDSR